MRGALDIYSQIQMNEQTELVLWDTGSLAAVFHNEALALRAEALEASALIGKVDDAKTLQAAVDAQVKIQTVLRVVDKARSAIAVEFIRRRNKVNDDVKEFVKELNERGNEIEALIFAYREKERVRLAAEARLQNAQLDRLEREEAEKLACASTIEEQDEIRDEYSARRQHVHVDPSPKAKGESVVNDWEISVTDIHALYRSHPNCVSLKPMLREIKMLVAGGTIPKGVTAKQVSRSIIHTAKQEKAIEA